MSEMLSGAEILCRALVDAGVEVIFGYPGGAIMPFYHALPDHPRLRHILVRHEQAAAHAADGYARASGRVAIGRVGRRLLVPHQAVPQAGVVRERDRKRTRLNTSHLAIS